MPSSSGTHSAPTSRLMGAMLSETQNVPQKKAGCSRLGNMEFTCRGSAPTVRRAAA